MKEHINFHILVTRQQLFQEMMVIEETIQDAITFKTQNPDINFCIENAHNSLDIVSKEYKNRL